MGRLFTKSDKQSLELVTGSEGEADHIVPYSKGGKTTVENGQILSPEANKKKGCFHFEPRQWQVEFLEAYENRKQGEPFLLIAIPGSGKTMAALEAFTRWKKAGLARDRYLIIVVPTKNLQEQWRDEAAKFGITLQTKDFGSNFKTGFNGGVVTYNFVANNQALFRSICSRAEVMCILDEVHHCGEDAHFGNGIKESFTLAKEKLLLSGTPWKSNGQTIPFVKYNGGGYAVGDYIYEYSQALSQGVVRYVVMDPAKGEMCNDLTGKTEKFDQDITEAEAANRLQKMLDPRGQYVRQMIKDANSKLNQLRQVIPNAAAMAACIDQSHALKVAEAIREVTGCEPSVIVSDADLENDTVKNFRNNSKPWLVCVKKVSEGTDIKRLQVLCYFSNVTTELFFRQLIGRVSRLIGENDGEAYVYIPADPRLIKCAENIYNAQVQGLVDLTERELLQLENEGPSLTSTMPLFESYTTSHCGREHVYIDGDPVDAVQYKQVQEIARQEKLPETKVYAVMQACTVMHNLSAANNKDYQQSLAQPVISLEEQMDRLRKQIETAVRNYARVTKCHWREVHNKYASHISHYTPQKEMSIGQLKEKLKTILEWTRDSRQFKN